jgi:hypothetical protein
MARVAAGAGALALMAGAAVAVQVAGMGAAHAAVTGVKQVTGPLSPVDSQPSKTVKATCPTGKRVVGGGGWAFATVAADETKVTLTELQPVHPASGQDYYEATGQEITPNITTDWWVQAFAVCADPIPGLHIIPRVSDPHQFRIDSFCLPGEMALGGGGSIDNPVNHIALSGVFPLGGGIAYTATVLPDSADFPGTWKVTAYAVCAPPPAGYEVRIGQSDAGTAPVKVANAFCSAGKTLLGPGATAASVSPPGVALQVDFPSSGLKQVEGSAVATRPVTVDWGTVVATAICVS